MKFLYSNNVSRATFEENLSEYASAEDIIRVFSIHGYPATDDQKLYLMLDGNTVPFSAEMLSTPGITIVYSDVVALNNAVGFDFYEGIRYFFHTDEKNHEHTPHVHAACNQAGGVLWIPLDNPENYIGHYNNSAKETQAVKYVKKNYNALMERWNKIMN